MFPVFDVVGRKFSSPWEVTQALKQVSEGTFCRVAGFIALQDSVEEI
jgi:hypothetical protein